MLLKLSKPRTKALLNWWLHGESRRCPWSPTSKIPTSNLWQSSNHDCVNYCGKLFPQTENKRGNSFFTCPLNCVEPRCSPDEVLPIARKVLRENLALHGMKPKRLPKFGGGKKQCQNQ